MASIPPEYLLVGTVLRPHGVRGDLLLRILTEFPERLSEVESVYLGSDHQQCRVVSARRHGREWLLKLAGVSDRNAAERLRQKEVYIRADDAMPLPPGRYYYHQVEGLEVVTDEGETLGQVMRIMETGANDVYVVRDEAGQEILLPAIQSVILEYDIARGRMLVHLLEGLR